MAVLELDGSHGEGGGQILRTALALSLITQTPFRIREIRKKRAKPGLRPQHLTAVRAAAQVGSASLTGNALNSAELTFRPGPVRAGTYRFDVGTAGSTTLVFQTVLPALLLCPGVSTLTLEGGTHNSGCPPFDFIERVFLPVLRRMGAVANCSLQRIGFAPAGGGKWTAEIISSQQGLKPIELHERGEARARSARSLVANLPIEIALRELAVVSRLLEWPKEALHAESVEAAGAGNVLMIESQFTHVSELVTGFGKRGLPAETVAKNAADCWTDYESAGVPVGGHLADQLLVPLALAGGGSFHTVRPSLHAVTNADVISKFLPIRFRIEQLNPQKWWIEAEAVR